MSINVLKQKKRMRYLSIDIEATGLREKDYIIELAFVPFDPKVADIPTELSMHTYVKCPSFESLKPTLDPWVIEHNEKIIKDAHSKGLEIPELKEKITQYLESLPIRNYFGPERITLFGKSMNAIDLPFLSRDLGFEFMRKYFHHQDLDLSSSARTLIDMGILPAASTSGSELMKLLGMGEVAHNALEDAVNTAKMYIGIVNKFGAQKKS